MKILIIDDEPVTVAILKKIVESNGCETVCATTAEEGWEFLKHDPSINLALVDWMLPGMSGVEFCFRVREEIKNRFVYLMLVTGKTDSNDMVEGLRAGADAYVKKPICKEVLLSQIEVGTRIATLQTQLIDDQVRLRAQQESLNHLLERQSKLLSAIPSFFLAIDNNDNIMVWNDAAERLFGISSPDALRRPFIKLPVLWDWDEILKLCAKARFTNEMVRREDLKYTSRGCSEGYLDISIVPLDKNTMCGELLIIGEEVTEKKLLNDQLTQAQRLESIGQLASGIAHEINTPLQFVGDNLRFLQSSYGQFMRFFNEINTLIHTNRSRIETAAIQKIADQVDLDFITAEVAPTITESLEGIARLAHIIEAMKEISHPGSKEKTPVDVCHLIDTAITVSTNAWKYVAEVSTQCDPSIPLVKCYPNELSQALLNIIINAAHAIEDARNLGKEGKGRIDIRALAQGNTLVIEVNDNGCGISKKAQPKIFDQFFTTKGVGRGTGQGLAIAHSAIVKLHGGALTFTTEANEGTSFCIQIPLEEEEYNDVH